MNVAIIGGGAIGLLISAYFSKKNINVTLYTRTKIQADTINENGIKLEKNNETLHFKINAKSLSDSLITEEIVIITVKQYDVKDVIDRITKCDDLKEIMFIQNGMSHIQLLQEIEHLTVWLSVVEHGAIRKSLNTVCHTGVGRIKASKYCGHGKLIGQALDCVNDEDFLIMHVSNWYDMLAYKLLANAVINPLTALFQIQNGELLTNDSLMKNMKQLFNEVTSIINIDNKNQAWDDLIKICQNTSGNYSSMLMDIKNGRKTEIDAILGYVTQEAKKTGKQTPICSFLYESIKVLEGRGKEHAR